MQQVIFLQQLLQEIGIDLPENNGNHADQTSNGCEGNQAERASPSPVLTVNCVGQNEGPVYTTIKTLLQDKVRI